MHPVSRSDAGITLAEVAALGALLLVAGTLVVPCLARATRHGQVVACADNLRALHAAQGAYAARHGAPPAETGKAFWRALLGAAPPLVAPERLLCPLVETPPGPEECRYFGPGEEVSRLKDTDPMGCDEPYNHSPRGREGGNVLFKSGQVRTDASELWTGTLRTGKCRP